MYYYQTIKLGTQSKLYELQPDDPCNVGKVNIYIKSSGKRQ